MEDLLQVVQLIMPAAIMSGYVFYQAQKMRSMLDDRISEIEEDLVRTMSREDEVIEKDVRSNSVMIRHLAKTHPELFIDRFNGKKLHLKVNTSSGVKSLEISSLFEIAEEHGRIHVCQPWQAGLKVNHSEIISYEFK